MIIIFPFLYLFLLADLSLGDVHIVPVDDVMSRDDGRDLVSEMILLLYLSLYGVSYLCYIYWDLFSSSCIASSDCLSVQRWEWPLVRNQVLST